MNSAGLARIRERLQSCFENVFVCEQGSGAFISVETKERAIEIAPTQYGKWWLEMWMALEAGGEESAGESTVDSVDKAIGRAMHWLHHGKRNSNDS